MVVHGGAENETRDTKEDDPKSAFISTKNRMELNAMTFRKAVELLRRRWQVVGNECKTAMQLMQIQTLFTVQYACFPH